MTDAGDKPLMQVEGLCFRYRGKAKAGRQTLEGITFDLFQGETLGVVGRNGAGKSTLLRLITGVMSPTSGTIIKEPGIRCGLLSLGVGFMNDLTGADNVVMTLMLQGFTESSARALLDEIQEFSELGDAFNERVKTYSSGMRSRLTFSAALHSRCEVLLIDEVLSVGDASFKAKARAALTEKINSDQTVVFVSHSEEIVRVLCDRALWIEEGQIRAIGAAGDVLDEFSKPRASP